MKPVFTMRLDEGLRQRLEARAVLEGRSLANLIERLLELGLGQMVTERGGAAQDALVGRATAGTAGTPTSDGANLGSRSLHAPRSVTVCSRIQWHRSGEFCKGCGQVPA